MSIFNLLCSICTEVIHNGDDIHCTSCGHIMHCRCIVKWRECSGSCSQCRSPNPTTHKLFLSFDESAESATNMKELQAELLKFKDETNGLKNDLEEKTNEISELKEKHRELNSQYTQRFEEQVTEREKLNENIEHLEEKNISQSHEIENLSMELENLKSSNDVTVNELKSELLQLKSKEYPTLCQDATERTITALNEELRKIQIKLDNSSLLLQNEVTKNAKLSEQCMNLESKDCELGAMSCQFMLCKEKNKTLEQKLIYITSQFEKEISKSTQLEIQNMKLQNYVDCMKSNATTTNSKNHIPTLGSQRKTRVVASTNESLNTKNGRTYSHFDSSSNSIVIQKYPTINLQYPLENVILFIAVNIGVEMDKYAIDKVNIVNGNRHKLRKIVSLFVRFKTKELKNQFLLNKTRLLVCPTPYLKLVQIREYIDDGAQSLFAYAIEKLKGKGYNHVFWTNNQIFAKRQMSDQRGIRILSCQQVDELLEKELNLSNES